MEDVTGKQERKPPNLRLVFSQSAENLPIFALNGGGPAVVALKQAANTQMDKLRGGREKVEQLLAQAEKIALDMKGWRNDLEDIMRAIKALEATADV